MAVFGVAAFLLFFRLGEGSLHSWTEAIYAQISREILRTGDWLTLHYNGRPYLKKPPLFMWLTALSYRLLGIGEFSARLFSPLFALGIFGLVYVLGRSGCAWPVGLGAIPLLLHGVRSWTYAHRSNFLALCRTANLDIPLTFFITWSLYLLWKGRNSPRLLIWMGLPLGLGIMTKSAVGLVPIAIAFLFAFLTRRRFAWSWTHLVLGCGLGLLLALPWHLCQWILHGREFWNDYVSTTLISRASSYLTRVKNETYYLRVLRKGFGPAIFLAPLALVQILRSRLPQERDFGLLLVTWSALPLLLFTLSRDKNGWYIAPIYPAMALLLALLLWRMACRIPKGTWAYAVIIFLLFATSLHFPAPADPSREAKALAPCIQRWVPPGQTLYEYGLGFVTPDPKLVFYADRMTRSAGRRPLSAVLSQDDLFLVTTTRHWKNTGAGKLLCRSGEWILLRSGEPSGKSLQPLRLLERSATDDPSLHPGQGAAP